MSWVEARRTLVRGGICAGVVLVLVAGRLEAAPITDFDIFAARDVFVGGGTTVGQSGNPSLVGSGTTTGGVNDFITNAGGDVFGDVRAAQNVTLGNNTFVTGTITNDGTFTTGSGVTFGSRVDAAPDLATLPAASVYSAGSTPQSAINNATLNLAPGSYSTVTLGGNVTLNLIAGDYFISNLTAGNGLKINVNLNMGTGGELNLFLTGFFRAGGVASMAITGGTFRDVFVETHQTGLNAFQIGGGGGTNWKGRVFTPNGDIHLGSGSSSGLVEGDLWAGRDVDLEHGLIVVPEPTSLALFAVALLGLAGVAYRR